MAAVQQFFRFIHIIFILLRHGLDRFIWASPLFKPLHFLIIFLPWRWFGNNEIPSGNSIRLALEQLGPIYVKFGQLLSTRRDLLPDDIADELAKLQDRVPPFSKELARTIIEKSLRQPVESLFQDFEEFPLACASISQVHAATLHDGTKVVVKVLRPKVEQEIRRDVELLQTFARLLYRFVARSRRFRPLEVVEEFKCTLDEEIDLMREAANASQLRRNFTHHPSLYVPKIFWEYTRKNILVIERVQGVPISQVEILKAKNVNLKYLAEEAVKIFLKQVFEDCFFHGDMHPGNIFVMTEDPQKPRYIAVDFGIMGTLGPADQHYLGENFLAFFQRDYRRVAELHVQSGWVPPHIRVESFESAIRGVCEPIFERPLKEISFGQTLLRLFQTASRFEMQVQPQLVLLQKTLLAIEGLGRQLYPDLDLWHTAKPYLEEWMKRHYGFRGFYHNIKDKLPLWTDKLPEIPEAIHDVLQFWQHKTRLQQYQQTLKQAYQTPLNDRKEIRLSRQIFGAALIVSTALLALPFLENLSNPTPWLVGIGLLGIFFLFKK